MTYATEQDLIDRAGPAEILQVADRHEAGAADPDAIAGALAEADRRIDAHLGVRFAIPLSTVPAIVTSWAVSIARYHLHRDGAPEHVVRDYKDALRELERAGAGLIALPGVDGTRPDQSSEGATRGDGSPSVFGRENLEGWL